ncbi:MAG: hypothetical protein ABH854_04090 [Candidatus Diapherotrites archaeon]
MAAETGRSIDSIIARNARVEQDKAWETSKTRRAIIAVATYIVILYFLLLINAPNPYFNAMVPAAAYVLSTLSIPFIKNIWANKFYKK